MKPAYYVNLRIARALPDSRFAPAAQSGPGGLANSVMSLMLRVVHGICAAQGAQFAVAFPQAKTGQNPHPGSVLRVFMEDRAVMEGLLDRIETHDVIPGYVHIDRVRQVPEGTEGTESTPGSIGSVSYELVRIPAASKNVPLRMKRIAEGDALPFVKMVSRTGNTFSLRFRVTKQRAPSSLQCEPNGYGLSVPGRPFFLPDLPLERAPWDKAPARRSRQAEMA
jgi:hypothetical protein